MTGLTLTAALRAAHLSEERAVGANILGFMAIQAASSDNPRDAVLLTEFGLAVARELTPAVEAMLHTRLGRGAACAGDANIVDSKLCRTT